MAQINVQNTKITVLDIDNKDYICLTDMAGAKENDVRAADVIKNWLRNRYTLEFDYSGAAEPPVRRSESH